MSIDTLEDIIDSIPGDWRIYFEAEKDLKQALNLYIEERVREGKIEELNKAKEWCSGDLMCNYQDILDRLKELENTPPRGLKGDI